MPRYSSVSQGRLDTCIPELRLVFNEVILVKDCSILCGHRGMNEQQRLFRTGKSQLDWPESKHNSFPSRAVDVVPYPVDWEDLLDFEILAAIAFEIAQKKGIALEWGGNWKSFKDYPHWQVP